VVFALANLPWVESQNQISHSVGWLVEISVGRNKQPVQPGGVRFLQYALGSTWVLPLQVLRRELLSQ